RIRRRYNRRHAYCFSDSGMHKIHRAMTVPAASAQRSEHVLKILQPPGSASAGRLRGKLNLFQATMLRWRALHPYSAVHVVRVERALSPALLRRCIEKRLEAAGLSGLVLDRPAG